MIGHYLLTLSREQEDRVLTHPFGGRAQRCLCMLVGAGIWGAPWEEFRTRDVPGAIYERLICRFRIERINNAIRNRILSNRARRVLQNISVGVGEDRPAL